MIYLILENTTEKDFDIFKYFKDAPLMQTKQYADWQKTNGKEVRSYFIKNTEGKVFAYFQIIFFSLTSKWNYGYTPYGPLVSEGLSQEELQALSRFLKLTLSKIARDSGSAFIRLDFSIYSSRKIADAFTKPLRQSTLGSHFQPRAEWRLNLASSEEDILKNMHQKTRYSINLSLRKELKCEKITEDLLKHFDTFYAITKETAERDGFSLHTEKYYRNIFENCECEKNAMLILISHKDTTLVANLLIFYGDTAYYLFGSTRNDFRNLMPAYKAQWEGIVEAKKKGSVWYNFGGISTVDFPHKGWEGITLFKQKFGGEVLLHPYMADIISNRWIYSLYIFRKIILSLFS